MHASAPPAVHGALQSYGYPLNAPVRDFMEPRFGYDFGSVRVHTDARADESARAMNALAYTVGHDVVFRQGRYDPGSSEGRRLLAHELAHIVQQRGGAGVVMRQVDESHPDHAVEGTGEPEPHQCEDDAALDAAYEEWIHYDPVKDAEETALVARINQEIFGPINQERNRIAADSYETTLAYNKAFPTGSADAVAVAAAMNQLALGTAPQPGAGAVASAGISAEKMKLFNAPRYGWLHADTVAAEDERKDKLGLATRMGDISSTGVVSRTVFGEKAEERSIWDYRGANGMMVGGPFVSRTPRSDLENFSNIAGYAEFQDVKHSKIFIPQLGFAQKPVFTAPQIMCGLVPVVKPGRAKRRDGPRGKKAAGFSLRNLLRGGKRFFGTDTDTVTTGMGEALGQRDGPDKPLYWYFKELPIEEGGDSGDSSAETSKEATATASTHEADDERDVRKPKSKREQVDESMRRKADAVMARKSRDYENLKQYYLSRAAFIAKYRDQLK